MIKFFWINAKNFPYQVLSFENPLEVLRLETPSQLEAFFERLQNFIKKGFYACGFLTYELGYLLENRLKRLFKKSNLPLACFFIYSRPTFFFVNSSDLEKNDFNIDNLAFNISKELYLKDLKRIKEYIASGDVYQVNYTFKLKFTFKGHPSELFYSLLFSQRCKYGFYIEEDDFLITSLSPELFLKKEGSFLISSPMKGTIKRGGSFSVEQRKKRELFLDEKNRAENVMIVDLLRNDLGRVCHPGEVWVKELFKVETYPTLHQMISTIKGRLCKEEFPSAWTNVPCTLTLEGETCRGFRNSSR